MSLGLTTSAAAGPGTIATIIVSVLAASAFLAWMMWRACKSAERAERDARYLRRRLFQLGILYVGCAVYGIEEVATGKEHKEILLGLPIGLTLAWLYLRAASRVKIPPP